MKFVSIRELRSKTAVIREDLRQAREIVITTNPKFQLVGGNNLLMEQQF